MTAVQMVEQRAASMVACLAARMADMWAGTSECYWAAVKVATMAEHLAELTVLTMAETMAALMALKKAAQMAALLAASTDATKAAH